MTWHDMQTMQAYQHIKASLRIPLLGSICGVLSECGGLTGCLGAVHVRQIDDACVHGCRLQHCGAHMPRQP